VVNKFLQNNVRYADVYKEAARPFTNHPVCAAEEWELFIEAQPPPPGNEVASTAVIDFESPEIRRLCALQRPQREAANILWDPGICVGNRELHLVVCSVNLCGCGNFIRPDRAVWYRAALSFHSAFIP